MTNCRAPPKKVQAKPLASRGDISSNPRKQYANGEPGRARRTDAFDPRGWNSRGEGTEELEEGARGDSFSRSKIRFDVI